MPQDAHNSPYRRNGQTGKTARNTFIVNGHEYVDMGLSVSLDFGYSDTLDCDMIGWQSSFKSHGNPVRPVTE